MRFFQARSLCAGLQLAQVRLAADAPKILLNEISSFPGVSKCHAKRALQLHLFFFPVKGMMKQA
jgi:hypothetical protein